MMFNPVRRSQVSAAVTAGMAVLTLAVPATAQNETALKSYFEGSRVTLRIDMPGTSGGVDVQADVDRAVDYQRYGDDLKRYGTAIHAGDSVSVTLVKVKKDLVEFQLGGGGFGTFGDDTSTSVTMPLVEKSEREKNLERRVREEDDRDRRRELQRDLDGLRDGRERQNRRITVERERAEERKRERVASERLSGGSRFNLRYADRVPVSMRPEDLIQALTEYIDFRPADARAEGAQASTGTAGDVNLLRKGMLRADAERALGTAVESSERREGGLVIRTFVFDVGDQRIAADFIEDVLIRYTITSK
jgi:hypothetical protein